MAITKEVVQSEFQRLLGRAASDAEVASRIAQNAPNLEAELKLSEEYKKRQASLPTYSQRGLTPFEEHLAANAGQGGQEGAKTQVNPATGLTEITPGQSTSNALAMTFGASATPPVYSAENKRAIENPVNGQLPGGYTNPLDQARAAADKYAGLTPDQAALKMKDETIAQQATQINALNESKRFLDNQVRTLNDQQERIQEDPFLPATEKKTQYDQIQDQKRNIQEKAVSDILQSVPNALSDPTLLNQLMQGAAAGMSLTDLERLQAAGVAEAQAGAKLAIKQFGEAYVKPEKYQEYIDNAGLDQYGDFTEQQIAAERAIPEERKRFYFGDENTIGEAQKVKDMALQGIKQITDSVDRTVKSLTELNDISVQMKKLELASQLADVEEKKQQTKTYLTGYLAKIGALNTTGAAGNAVANLEAKYDRIKSETQQKYSLMMQESDIKFGQQIQDVSDKGVEKASSILADANKSVNDMIKDLIKADEDANRRIADLQKDYMKETIKTSKEALDYANRQTKEELEAWLDIVDAQGKSIPASVISKVTETRAKDKATDDAIKALTIKAKQAQIAASQAAKTKYGDLNDTARAFAKRDVIIGTDGRLYQKGQPGYDTQMDIINDKASPINPAVAADQGKFTDKNRYANEVVAPYIMNTFSQQYNMDPKAARSIAFAVMQSEGWDVESPDDYQKELDALAELED